MLGNLLTDQILKSVGYDTDNTVFSFIPNTAEIAYYGMLEGLDDYLNSRKSVELLGTTDNVSSDRADQILPGGFVPRSWLSRILNYVPLLQKIIAGMIWRHMFTILLTVLLWKEWTILW